MDQMVRLVFLRIQVNFPIEGICWRSTSLISLGCILHLALGLQTQCGDDFAQFDKPVVFVRLVRR